jgi:hypothetical protein
MKNKNILKILDEDPTNTLIWIFLNIEQIIDNDK